MAYIDTRKLKIPKGFFEDLNTPKLLDWLNSQPTADVEEVRHGEYVQRGAWHIECSVCGNVLAHIGEEKNYCPNCGAKMDGEMRDT